MKNFRTILRKQKVLSEKEMAKKMEDMVYSLGDPDYGNRRPVKMVCGKDGHKMVYAD